MTRMDPQSHQQDHPHLADAKEMEGRQQPASQPYQASNHHRDGIANSVARIVHRLRRLGQQIRAHRVIAVPVLAGILLIALVGVVSAVQMYEQYATARSEAVDGMKHLKRVQSMLRPEMKQLTIPDPGLLKSVEAELKLAEADFAHARSAVGGWGFAVAGHMLLVDKSVDSGTRLIVAADEVSLGGLSLIRALQIAQPLLHTGFLASKKDASTPVLTATMLAQMAHEFETAMRHFNVASRMAQSADLSTIPASLVSASQRAELDDILSRWPDIQTHLHTIDSWLKLAPTFLGVTTPQKFLVELLDRGEVRSTGGFIGSYGILTIQSGQIQPFTLNDVFALDVPYIQRVGLQPPPAKYAWWPFAGYGLRDSNLSFDFPTSAMYGIQMLKKEGGPEVQGVIAITIPVIERIMKVIGSVQLPQYDVTVTSENLESLIRYYTETKAANVGSDLPPGDQLTTLHERFTALLGRAVMDKLHKASSKQLSSIAQILLSSLPDKDLQMYFSDPSIEGLLKTQGFDNSLYRGPDDALAIVDSNTSANKANLFTTANYRDAVTIDADGTATHHLTITYNFSSATDPRMARYLFHRNYYRTYLRIYAPDNARLRSYDGFNGGQKRINLSDEPGRQMWGGYVVVQDGIAYSLHFTWTVAHAATKDSTGHWHYQFVVQRQASSRQHLVLTVTLPGASQPALSFHGNLDHDRVFVV